jgi:succinate-semialdehyde dehydrogenase/glutarate-semialdehyde dehydrogenase
MLLEMGGNGPMIVLHDADVEAAAAAAAFGCFFNAGQVCSAAERLLVHERVHDQFAERMVEHAKAVVLGNPLDPATTMGPLNNPAVARKTAEHVADAIDRGAALRHGGFAPQDLGSALYYAPTVLTGVTEDSDIAREETFGPVAPILKVSSDDEALRIAKDNRYGLVGAVFTRDLARAFRFIEELPVGIVNVNETTNYWELQIPFGGKSGKDSGIGRLGGRHTLLAMTDIKTATLNVG